MAKADEKSTETEHKEELPCLIRHFTIITRVCAVIVIIALWGCVFLLIDRVGDEWWKYEVLQWYLIFETVTVTFIEIVMLPVACFCTHLCCGWCWEPLAEGWINSITYSFLALPNFLLGYNEITSIVAGLLIIALAAVYSMKTLTDVSNCCPRLCPCLSSGSKSAAEPTSSSPLRNDASGKGSYDSQEASSQP